MCLFICLRAVVPTPTIRVELCRVSVDRLVKTEYPWVWNSKSTVNAPLLAPYATPPHSIIKKQTSLAAPTTRCLRFQGPAYERFPVSKNSSEWKRVQRNLKRSLPRARLTGLDRVQNRHTWAHFYQKLVSKHEVCGCHVDFTRAGSAIKELWHASGAIDIICKSKIG